MLRGTRDKQIQLEEEQRHKGIEKYLREINEAIVQGRLQETVEGKLLVKLGFEPLRDKIQEYIETPTRGVAQKDKNFLILMSENPDVIAFIVLSSLISLAGTSNVTVTSAARIIATDLKRVYFFDRRKEDNPKLHNYLGAAYKRASKKRKRELIEKHIKDLHDVDFSGNENALGVRVGTQLIHLLIQSGANIVEITRKRTGLSIKKKYVIALTKEAQEVLLKSTKLEDIVSRTTMLPTVVEPMD